MRRGNSSSGPFSKVYSSAAPPLTDVIPPPDHHGRMLLNTETGGRQACSKTGLALSLSNSTTALPTGLPAAGCAACLEASASEGNLVLQAVLGLPYVLPGWRKLSGRSGKAPRLPGDGRLGMGPPLPDPAVPPRAGTRPARAGIGGHRRRILGFRSRRDRVSIGGRSWGGDMRKLSSGRRPDWYTGNLRWLPRLWHRGGQAGNPPPLLGQLRPVPHGPELETFRVRPRLRGRRLRRMPRRRDGVRQTGGPYREHRHLRCVSRHQRLDRCPRRPRGRERHLRQLPQRRNGDRKVRKPSSDYG
ncbi:hypothetical protein LOS8367_03063 [Limimaricola soesokkakensis]|uniref:Uncharacterized protein n=1 Tax=Limimaricola soesokkakensis TaxID=1343159 RepID=A0A1X6ZVZ2_9RHOB|nr:hypothetical protein LOS8367_03063 [Limimaricola soesokkakensis]